MRSYAVWIAAIAVTGWLGYRQWSLERRVSELSEQLGVVSAAADAAGTPPSASHTARAPAASTSHAERLRSLEDAVSSVRADLRSLEKATSDLPLDPAVTDQQILSVMKEQGAKVMEKQLSFHRERWLDQREVALADFSRRFALTDRQNEQLWGLLSVEIDRMVEILSDPESFEDPEKAAVAWKQVLLDTDTGAHRILEREKAVAWDQTRFLERKLLWPWLPE